jgi:hypothetical protein
MSKGGTSVSNLQVPRASRRSEAQGSRLRVPMAWTVHVFLIGLAVVIWWIARDMVSVTRSLQDSARVRVELSPELEGQWRILSSSTLPVTLEVSGPTKEINDFASELETNPGRFDFLYQITPSEVANLRANQRQQAVLRLDFSKLADSAESPAPAELTVRPLAGDRIYQVTLERYVARPAWVDLDSGITGRISGYSYERRIQGDLEIEVFGPASQVEAITGDDGRARLQVAEARVEQLVANKASVERREERSILDEGKLITTLPLVPVEGVQARRPDSGVPVQQVPVEITFMVLQNYVDVRGDFPVSVTLPGWLVQRGAVVRGLPSELTVELEVLNNQRGNFNRQNVEVVLDLSHLTPDDVSVETPESVPGLHRAKASLQHYRLRINRDRLTYRFKNPDVTTDRYYPITEVTIEWTE